MWANIFENGAVEPEPEPSNFLLPEPRTFGWWSWSRKCIFRFHSPSLWLQILQWFSVFRGPNHSATRGENMSMLGSELELKT